MEDKKWNNFIEATKKDEIFKKKKKTREIINDRKSDSTWIFLKIPFEFSEQPDIFIEGWNTFITHL